MEAQPPAEDALAGGEPGPVGAGSLPRRHRRDPQEDDQADELEAREAASRRRPRGRDRAARRPPPGIAGPQAPALDRYDQAARQATSRAWRLPRVGARRDGYPGLGRGVAAGP